MTVDYRELTVRTMDELLIDFDGDLTEQRKMKNFIWSIWWRLRRIGLDDLLPEVINFILTPRAPADGSVTMEKLAQDVIDFILTPRAPADNSVNTQHLVDKSVTVQKLGDDVLNLIGEIGQLAAEQLLFGCLPMEFSPTGDPYSVQYLVQARDPDGCVRIATYSPTASTFAMTYTNSVWGTTEPRGTEMRPRPDESVVGTHIYVRGTLGEHVAAGTVNEAVLFGPGNRNILAQVTFTRPVDSIISIDWEHHVGFAPLQNDGTGATLWLNVELNGVIPLDVLGGTVGFGIVNNFLSTFSKTITIGLAAGTHTMRFIMSSYDGKPPVRLPVSWGPDETMGNAYWRFRTAVL